MVYVTIHVALNFWKNVFFMFDIVILISECTKKPFALVGECSFGNVSLEFCDVGFEIELSGKFPVLVTML